ncbi:hypothetical protein [Pseudomonas viridiflava]|uniref:hypothetical protein n=1 Tax=Pseudomonas viridiflava TaxID=33069 RepID=UPI0020BD7E1B|nr:hypothetical protein [Pseudomonas viridiflava]
MGVYDTRGNYSPTPGVCRPNGPAKPPPEPRSSEYILGKSDNLPAKNQFWMNLLEVTALFENLSLPESTVVANASAGSWSAKLASEFGPSFAQARAIIDDEGCEVFVTIGFSD